MYHTLIFLSALISVLTALVPATVWLYHKVISLRSSWVVERRRAASEAAGLEYWKLIN